MNSRRLESYSSCGTPADRPEWTLLQRAGVTLRLRSRQSLKLQADTEETIYVVHSGLVTLGATLPGRHRQGICMLYPGDILQTNQLPMLDGTDLVAMHPCNLSRIRTAALSGLHDDPPALQLLLQARAARLSARLSMHVTSIGMLTGAERLASLLIELALRLGRRNGSTIVIDIALKRVDMAEHLSMNGDTISRIMSRFRADGIVLAAGRRRIIVKDWDALRDMSPIAAGLIACTDPQAI